MLALQNYLVALLGSTIAAYKVLTVPEQEGKSDKVHPGVKSVVGLMLLITNNGFRHFVAEFFLSKIFDENSDILGGKTPIEEIFGGQEVEIETPYEKEHPSSHRMVVTPTPE
jgi:hypothetical protein